jgi:hypothetical protein
VVLKLLACLVEQKIKCMKSLLASMKTPAITYWQTYSNDHFSLDEEKICLNIPVHACDWAVYETIFKITAGAWDQVLRLQAAYVNRNNLFEDGF